MVTLNLGIVAHVDAGKTSLTERLLHAAGVIDHIGSVDHGDTQTDTLALERQRGITIRSAVVSFVIEGVTINLIDTPGHPDFIAEVERVLGVLDGAVLVVSAVEGVQPQTRVLMRTLQRLGIPTLIFVNKIDRTGGRGDDLLPVLGQRLATTVVSMGTVSDVGTRRATFTPYRADELVCARWAEPLAEHDDALLECYLDRPAALTAGHLRAALIDQTRRTRVHPVFFGSAMTGAGVDEVIAGITALLPAAVGTADGPASGLVFKVERGPAGDKAAYVRMFTGAVHLRERVAFGPTERTQHTAKITGIDLFADGGTRPASTLSAGSIGKLTGLTDCQIADVVGAKPAHAATGHQFDPPTLETVVVPAQSSDRGRLHAALAQLAEQDPLIDLRQDDLRREVSVSLYGEVQMEVLAATLAADYGLDVSFRQTSTICIERPAGTGEAVETIGPGNPFLATVGLRVGPAPVGSGVAFALEVELGSLPLAFVKATEDTVRETLRQGLHGWEVTDCTVTMTRSGYCPRQSHAHQGFDKSMSSTGWDFRGVTPLVLMAALRQAGTVVLEPWQRFCLEIPAELFGPVLPVLGRLRARPHTPMVAGPVCTVTGQIPSAHVHELSQQLPSLTRGEGVLECSFAGYEPVRGHAPQRPRTDHNPLDRKEYLLHVVRRV